MKLTCGHCGEELKLIHGATHECEIDVDETIKKNRESAIYATGYWNGIAAKKPRELTDEEIMSLSYLTSDNDPIDFARAILKKADEK